MEHYCHLADLLFRDEYEYFTRLSTGEFSAERRNVVVMGRGNWESVSPSAFPLVNRYNFVLSETLKHKPEGVVSWQYFIANFKIAIKTFKLRVQSQCGKDICFRIFRSEIINCN